MKETLLTVIVPIYNKENLLRQCLDSFASEKFAGRLEVLAIDDGSTDSSRKIALEYSDRYPEIYRVIQKKNGGVGSVMNVGLRNASGKYIREVDADDYVHTDEMEKMLVSLEDRDADIILTHFEWVSGTGRCLKKYYVTGVEYGKEYPIDALLGEVPFCIQSMTIRKRLLIENAFTFEETRYYVDMQLVSESIYHAATCMALNCDLYCYRLDQAEQSVNLESYVKNKESFKRQTELILERFFHMPEDGISEAKRNKIKGMACGYTTMLYVIYLMDRSKGIKDEWRGFDGMLRKKYPSIYSETGKNKMIRESRSEDPANMESCQEKIAEMIWELKSVDKGNVRLDDVCAFASDGAAAAMIYRTQQQRDKFHSYFRLLDHWLMICQQGNTVGRFFSGKGIRRIAIYGLGALGKRLYQELSDSEVRVIYGIDQKGILLGPGLRTYSLCDDLEEVDAIVVTVLQDFPAIREKLKKKVACPIVSLADVVYGS